MKTLWILLIVLAASVLPGTASAQLSVGINIGVPLSARYYYLQDIEAYYDLRTSMYIYPSRGRWIHARTLPASYGHYDFDRGHKVLIKDYRGTRPYNYYREHRSGFPRNGGSPDRNYWSPRERRNPVMSNNQQNKEYKQYKQYKKYKQYKQEVRRDRNDNGNRGNGRGNDKNHGNGNKR